MAEQGRGGSPDQRGFLIFHFAVEVYGKPDLAPRALSLLSGEARGNTGSRSSHFALSVAGRYTSPSPKEVPNGQMEIYRCFLLRRGAIYIFSL